MSALKYIAPVLAVVAGATAQTCGGTTTISSAADATALSNACGSRTFSGSIVLATGITDPIALDSITGISGSLTANNVTQFNSLSGNSIQSIGQMNLRSLTDLTTLSFPALTRVESIDWETLPALSGLSFEQGVQEVESLSIVDTELGTLEGINLEMADVINIENNRYLQSINMQLANVSQSLSINANGDMLQAEFPNLIWANNMTFRNVSSISIPSLQAVNGSMGFYGNAFSSLSAPNLTSVGDSLSFVNCESLTNVSMPELTMIGGGFQIASNPEYANITGFPNLATVGGAVDFNGDAIKTVQLPAIQDVRGDFNIQSREDITTACDRFSSISGSNAIIKGTFTCKGGTETPGGTGTLPAGTNSGTGDGSSPSTGAAHPILIPGATGLLGVMAAIFGLL